MKIGKQRFKTTVELGDENKKHLPSCNAATEACARMSQVVDHVHGRPYIELAGGDADES